MAIAFPSRTNAQKPKDNIDTWQPKSARGIRGADTEENSFIAFPSRMQHNNDDDEMDAIAFPSR